MQVRSCVQDLRTRRGFTLIELLVSITIISVLLALALPAVQSSREAARAAQCKSQIRQFGHALHNFESTFSSLPAGADYTNNNRHSWCTRILPFLEQSALYNSYNWSLHWEDTSAVTGLTNEEITQSNLSIFVCPSEPDRREGGMDYGGNMGTSLTGLPIGFSSGDGWEAGALLAINAEVTNPQTTPAKFGEFSDGLSQTFLVFECSGRMTEAGHWGSGTNCLAMENQVNSTLDSDTIFSRHMQGGHALFADGHVAFISNSADMNVLAKMATRNRSEVVESSF